jgi:hypothetical protein
MFSNGSEVPALWCFGIFRTGRDSNFSEFRNFPEFRLFGVPVFSGTSEFHVASTLLVGIEHPSGRHRPSFWSASTLLVGTFTHSALLSFLAVTALALPLRPSGPLGPLLVQRVGINPSIRFGCLRSAFIRFGFLRSAFAIRVSCL